MTNFSKQESVSRAMRRRLMAAIGAAGLVAMTASMAHAVTTGPPTGSQPTKYFMQKINVTNFQKSVDFYTKVMGMHDMQHYTSPTMTEAFLTQNGGDFEASLVLIYNSKRTTPLDMGNAFGSIAFITDDFKGLSAKLAAAGYPLGKSGDVKSQFTYSKTVTHAAGKDPDGYPIEVVQFNY